MNGYLTLQSTIRRAAAGAGVAVGAYATYVGVTWFRYGRVPRSDPEQHDELLDQFMPVFDVAERHHVDVAAPASLTVAVARDIDLFASSVVRTIFKGRELIFRAASENRQRPHGLIAEVQSRCSPWDGWSWRRSRDRRLSWEPSRSHGRQTSHFARYRLGSSRPSTSLITSRSSGHFAPIGSAQQLPFSAQKLAPSQLTARHERNSDGIGPSCPRELF
jgi:hypothetical protein